MSLSSFIQITKINWEKSAKMRFYQIKNGHISWNLEHLGQNFALYSGTTQDTSLWNITGISVKRRALGPGKRFKQPHTGFISSGGFNTIKHISFPHFIWDLMNLIGTYKWIINSHQFDFSGSLVSCHLPWQLCHLLLIIVQCNGIITLFKNLLQQFLFMKNTHPSYRNLLYPV